MSTSISAPPRPLNPMPNRRAVVLGAGAASLPWTARPLAAEPVVTIHGSTTFDRRLMSSHRDLIAKEAGVALQIVGMKSLHGLVALLEGRAMLAMISAPLATEASLVRQLRPELPVDLLQGFEIVRVRAAFVVNRGNPVRSLRLDTIRRVLAGQITSWADLGGADRPIRVVVVRDGGVILAVQNRLLDGHAVSEQGLIRVETAKQLMTVVAQEPDALGVGQLGLVAGSGAIEIATDGAVDQLLSLVSLGAPDELQRRVIAATLKVAQEKLF